VNDFILKSRCGNRDIHKAYLLPHEFTTAVLLVLHEAVYL